MIALRAFRLTSVAGDGVSRCVAGLSNFNGTYLTVHTSSACRGGGVNWPNSLAAMACIADLRLMAHLSFCAHHTTHIQRLLVLYSGLSVLTE
jgi:hypothetical protein